MSQIVIDLISEAAGRWGVPASLAIAVAERESGFRQSAVGTSGEIGVFQLMPAAASDMGVNRESLDGNIEGGVRYLRSMFDQFGDWGTALAAYNAGPGNVSRGVIPDSTKQYVSAVLQNADTVPAELPDIGAPAFTGGPTIVYEVLPWWAIGGAAAAGLGLLLLLRR
jgi:soluble lytic murein transglycosylase-like protein